MWVEDSSENLIAVHAIRNKGQAISAHDLRTGLERMADWRKRMK